MIEPSDFSNVFACKSREISCSITNPGCIDETTVLTLQRSRQPEIARADIERIIVQEMNDLVLILGPETVERLADKLMNGLPRPLTIRA